ncbi:MAG TPA: carboxypeptidase regulatory-like domain-containing protein, partial [Gemmatimonadales bacterium]|nr:carboxypeptidase regulatory-like domain-containing protein [Gemmatimonadales bacterium]
MGARLAVLGALAAALAAAPRLLAQLPPETGDIHGVVTDRGTDSAVAGAHVLLVGTQLATTTGEQGEFALVGIAPGRYTVRVLSLGYAPAVEAGVVVAAGATLELRVPLDAVALQLSGINVTATGSAQKLGESPVSVAVQ